MDDQLDLALVGALEGLDVLDVSIGSSNNTSTNGDGTTDHSDIDVDGYDDIEGEDDGRHLFQHLDPIDQPVLQRANPNPTIRVASKRQTTPRVVEEDVVLQLADPDAAYMRVPSKPEVCLDHHAPGWGFVYFAITLKRDRAPVDVPTGSTSGPSIDASECDTFQAPDTRFSAQYVAVKRLSLSVIRESIALGKKEDPYIEISRMQQFGDGIHILPCLGALFDDSYLYIITPYCEESLVSWIPWNTGVPEANARQVMIQIFDNLTFLQSVGLCHRDISPDNCFIYNGRVVFADLAMSFRLPPIDPQDGSILLMQPLGTYGKPAYLPPEVYFNMPFDPTSLDLWASTVILFNLVTGELLYKLPHPDDVMFRYFILAGGFSNEMNERTTEVFMGLSGQDAEQSALWTVAQKCMSTLSPDLLDLFRRVLRMSAHERWGLSDIIEHSRWMIQENPGAS